MLTHIVIPMLDFERLLTERESVAKITRWWIRRLILNPFKLAKDLIKPNSLETSEICSRPGRKVIQEDIYTWNLSACGAKYLGFCLHYA
jgi:hypothetical protein